MPIHPSLKDLYPSNWTEISQNIRFERARGHCEWCGAVHGQPHPETGSRVILATAHLDHNPANNAADNLAALCKSVTIPTTRASATPTASIALLPPLASCRCLGRITNVDPRGQPGGGLPVSSRNHGKPCSSDTARSAIRNTARNQSTPCSTRRFTPTAQQSTQATLTSSCS